MYMLLKQSGLDFTYEGETFETFEPFELEAPCFERATRRSKQMTDRRKVTKISYTPDFIGKDNEWMIECKGRANEQFPLRWKIFKKMIAEKYPDTIIFKPTNEKDCIQVIEELKKLGYGKN